MVASVFEPVFFLVASVNGLWYLVVSINGPVYIPGGCSVDLVVSGVDGPVYLVVSDNIFSTW